MATPLPIAPLHYRGAAHPAFASRAFPRLAQGPRGGIRLEGALAALALTPVALAIHGYHPYAEDGGLYSTAVLKMLHPDLYRSAPLFASVLTRYSVFPSCVAALVNLSRLPAAVIVFMLYLASVWATIFAAWLVVTHCRCSRRACYGAVVLLTLWLTLPAAGTSLLLVDPYLCARSISTPCALFALSAMLDLCRFSRYRRGFPWGPLAALATSMLLAAAVHPLMAGYATGCMALLFAASRPSRNIRATSLAALWILAVVVAASIYGLGPPLTPDYRLAASTRAYWFLHSWHWYELVGLIAPLLVIDLCARFGFDRNKDPKGDSDCDGGVRDTRECMRWMACMAVVAGSAAVIISLLFVHLSSRTYAVARLQPLRVFHFIYLVMILVLGAVAGERFFAAARWLTALAVLTLGGVMFYVQLQTFSASAHLELPGIAPRNGWEQAFVWIRQNTPADALFALDAHYITFPGEDAQYFSAIAERSALPDYSKDGGLAALSPVLARPWVLAVKQLDGFGDAPDALRLAALKSVSAKWMVLPAAAITSFPCPFQNSAVKVCTTVSREESP